ncbi:minor tail protein [Mycobacterium phage MalagasyRose]|uniref:Minor tail protein n=1 Tax=Mycobacterium phage MalagasyRose TaxID=2599870 RepID=A0A5J6TEV8_9CAUD|nr:minor tail protein [Mycobacterium phage MalagasyRose]QFG08874.1 minor tail protein [Mycobacterium phage MalagasyRose]
MGLDSLIERPTLEFTRYMDVMRDKLIDAYSKPDPNDPIANYRYLRRRVDALTGVGEQRPLVRLQDRDLRHIARVGNEISCRTEEIATEAGEASVVIRGGDYLADFVKRVRVEEDLHLSVDPNALVPTWRTRWGGKITTVNAKRDSKGVHTVELIATAQRQHQKHVLIAANPVSPPELQLPKMWFVPANARTGCALTMVVQFARLFLPVLQIPTNIMNPGSWLDVDLGNFSPLNWPQQVAFVNAFLDQSRTSLVAGTWTDFHSATMDILKDAGCVARSYTFFTEDTDNPHEELEALVGKNVAALARPQRNCVVHAFHDFSGHEGYTGTAADGVINLFATTADNLITQTVVRLDRDGDGEPDPLIQQALGIAPKPPWVCFREGQHSGIIESNVAYHKGPVKTIMTGGKSPKLVNDLQTFAIRFGLAQIEQVIPYPGSAYQQLLSSGLDNLYQGQLDNTAFAWMRFTDPVRALFTGDLAWQEHFERGGGVAYVISGVLTLRVGWYKKRAYRAFKVSVRNGRPFVYGRDFDLAHRVMFEQDFLFHVDQVAAARYEYARRTPVTWGFSIGDDTKDDDPLVQGIRALQAGQALLGMFLGEGTVFG